MKILFIGHERQLNGASKSLLDLIVELENKHVRVVLTAFEEGPVSSELKKTKVQVLVKPYYRWVIKKTGTRQWIVENLKWNIKRKFVNCITINEIVDFCMKNHVDIIHTNSGVIDIGGHIAEKANIPHLWHIREFADLDFDMYSYISKERYHKRMSQMADIYICNSKAVANHYNFLPQEKVRVVYNGVSLENYCKIDEKKTGDRINFLLAGRYSLAKGQDEAIRACMELYCMGITNFVLHLAGSQTENIIVPAELDSYICVHGEVYDMPNLRKGIDVELVCSRAEAFGRVTIEAMMSGIPVIGSNTGGTLELITDYENGLMYEYGNALNLATKMKFMIMNPKLRKDMGKRAQIFALKFTASNCAKNIEQLYCECINGGGVNGE